MVGTLLFSIQKAKANNDVCGYFGDHVLLLYTD